MGNGMNKILPGLYLGNFRDAKDKNQLQSNGITHIVSIHECAKPFFEDKKYFCILASDTSSQNMSQYFSEVNNFIHEARISGGNVLVHCLAGVSRSTTIVIAYLMSTTGLTWRDCLSAVQQARPCANPNFGFQRQLVEFQYNAVTEEKKRLLEKFPSSKELFATDPSEVQSAVDKFKKQMGDKNSLREEVRQIMSRSSELDMSCGDHTAENKSDDISGGGGVGYAELLSKTGKPVQKVPSVSCHDIANSLDLPAQALSNEAASNDLL